MDKFRGSLVLVVVLTLTLVGPPLMASAQANDPATIANTLITDLNTEKSDEALALFSDDAVIKYIPAAIPGSPFVGREQIRGWVLNARGYHQFNQIVGTPTLAGDKFSGTYQVADDRYRQSGIDYVEFNGELTVQGGKIKALTATISPASLVKLQQAASARTTVPQAAPNTGTGVTRLGSTDSAYNLVMGLGLLLFGTIALAGLLLIRLRHRTQ